MSPKYHLATLVLHGINLDKIGHISRIKSIWNVRLIIWDLFAPLIKAQTKIIVSFLSPSLKLIWPHYKESIPFLVKSKKDSMYSKKSIKTTLINKADLK